MFYIVRNRTGFSWSFLQLTLGFGILLSLAACKKQEQPAPAEAAPKTFATPRTQATPWPMPRNRKIRMQFLEF